MLLAKSDGTGLREHTDQVAEAARRLYTILPAAPDLERAAFYHDLGKGEVLSDEDAWRPAGELVPT